jgi:transposase-like protein
MQDFPSYTSPSSNTHKMVNEDDMKKALAEIESSSKPNYTEIAKKHSLVPSTLLRRVQGKTTSRADFQSQVHQCLTNAQERILINQINRLTERGIPPTSQMVKNFAEEMIGRAVGKN